LRANLLHGNRIVESIDARGELEDMLLSRGGDDGRDTSLAHDHRQDMLEPGVA
jgi:hypothetical protein